MRGYRDCPCWKCQERRKENWRAAGLIILTVAMVVVLTLLVIHERAHASTLGTTPTIEVSCNGVPAASWQGVVVNPLSREDRPVYAPAGLTRVWTDKAGVHSYTDTALVGWWVRVPVVRVCPGLEVGEITGVMLRDGKIWTRMFGIVDMREVSR